MADIDYLDLVGPNGEKQLTKLKTDLRAIVKDMVEANRLGREFEVNVSGAKTLKDITDGTKSIVDINGKLVQSQVQVSKVLAEAAIVKERYNGSTKDVLATSEKLIRLNTEEAKTQTNLNKAELEAEKIRTQKAKTSEALAIAERARTKSMIDQERELDRLIKLEEKENIAKAKTNAKASRDARELSNDYELLKKAYIDQSNYAKNLGVTLGLNSPIFKQASADALKMFNILDGVENAVGQNQRRVGAYASGFSGLSNSIQQILREAPSAAISLNTFFLAISNNLPIFFDEIQKIKAAQKEANVLLQESIVIAREAAIAQALQAGATAEAAAAEALLAEQTIVANAAQAASPSLLKQIGKSLFSVNTLLTLLVLGLTLFGGKIVDWVEKVFKGKEAVDSLKKSAEVLNKAIADTDYIKAVEQVNQLRINVDLAKKGLLDQEKVLHEYNTTLGKTTGEVKNLSDVEAFLVNHADAYIQMMLYKTAATLSLNDAAKKLIANQKDMDKAAGTEKLFGGIAGATTDADARRQFAQISQRAAVRQQIIQKENDKELDIVKAFQKKAAEIAKQNNFDLFGGTQDEKAKKDKKDKGVPDNARQEYQGQKELNEAIAALRIQQIEQDKAANEQIFQDEKNSLSDRLLAYENYASDRIYQAEAARDKEIANARAEGTSADKQLNDGKKKTQELVNSLKDIKAAARVKEQTAEETYQATIANIATEGAKAITDITQKEMEKQRAIRQELFRSDELAIQQGNEAAVLALQKRYMAGEISTRDYEAKLTGLHRKGLLDQAQAEIDFYAAEALRTDITEKEKGDALSHEVSAERKKYDLLLELQSQYAKARKQAELALASEIVNVTEQLIGKLMEKEKNRNNEAITGIEQQAQKDIDLVNKSVATKQEKEDRIAAINKKAQADKEVLDNRNKRIAKEQAQIEMLVALIRVGVNTAEKVAAIQMEAAVLASNPLTIGIVPLALSQIPFVIAAGAVGAAGIVAAAAINSFAKGTDSAPEGLAWVGEEGTELRINPDNSVQLTPSKPTLTYLEQGTQIIPHDQLMSLAYPTFGSPSVSSNALSYEMLKELKQLNKLGGIKRAIEDLELNTHINISTTDRDYLNMNVYK